MTMEYSGRGDLKRSMELLWGTKEPPTRGPKPGLSVDEIVQAGIRLADTEGLPALSMRRIANELGVTTMALYRYVPSKAELLDVMFDRVVGEVRRPDNRADGWRERLELSAREDWALYHRHPWLIQVATPRPPMGPNVIGVYDAQLQAVADTGLTAKERMAIVELVSEYVHGTAFTSVATKLVVEQTGVGHNEWWEAQGKMLESVFDEDLFPGITEIANSGYLGSPVMEEASPRLAASRCKGRSGSSIDLTDPYLTLSPSGRDPEVRGPSLSKLLFVLAVLHEVGGDIGGHDRQQADSHQHQQHGQASPLRCERNHVAVADRGGGDQRPPDAVDGRGDL
jgi:AcrR family transcriptional regulator